MTTSHQVKIEYIITMIVIIVLLLIITFLLLDRKIQQQKTQPNTKLQCIAGLLHNPIGQQIIDENGHTIPCDRYSNTKFLQQ